MKTYSGTSEDGKAIYYADKNRWLWPLSVSFALIPILAVWLHYVTGREAALFAPLVLVYVVVPLLDLLIGEDSSNPPEQFALQMDKDPYYKALTFIIIPFHFVSLIITAWWAATQDLSLGAYLGLAIIAGLGSGLAINTGHELGHKKSKLERNLAKIVLAVPGYGHFWIEHSRGHHRDVSTPEDPASARMGENIYAFALREIPGAFVRAWAIESERLLRRGRSQWHPQNQILQSFILTVILQGGLLIAFGWILLPFLLLHNVVAWLQLTSANYIEHYGLLREKTADGKYERCAPHHSWNSNHKVSNLLLFHLQRHSDHHAHPLRRYQALRHFEGLPTLPNGYFGAYLMAYVPWLWFRIMDPKLLSLPHIDGDANKVNIAPGKEKTMYKKYAKFLTAETT